MASREESRHAKCFCSREDSSKACSLTGVILRRHLYWAQNFASIIVLAVNKNQALSDLVGVGPAAKLRWRLQFRSFLGGSVSAPMEDQIPGCAAVARCTSVRNGITAKLFFTIFAAVAFVFPQPISTQGQKAIRRVLLFNDFGYMVSPGIMALDQAIVAELEQSPYQIELYTETLESTLFSDEASQRRIRAWIALKYSDRKPDVIITAGAGVSQVHDRIA